MRRQRQVEVSEVDEASSDNLSQVFCRHIRVITSGREVSRSRDCTMRLPWSSLECLHRRSAQPTLAFFFARCPSPGFPSAAAAWYFRRISAMSTRAGGNFNPISLMVSLTICEIARLRNHL